MGVYLTASPSQIRATKALLQHFRQFLASDCTHMHNPITGWKRETLDKQQARQKLSWLINIAINRKAGITDAEPLHLLKGQHWQEIREQAKRIITGSENVRIGHFTPQQRRVLAKVVKHYQALYNSRKMVTLGQPITRKDVQLWNFYPFTS